MKFHAYSSLGQQGHRSRLMFPATVGVILAAILLSPCVQAGLFERLKTARKLGLPKDIKWESNTAEPLIGDPKALKGGTFNTYIQGYPLTFRLMGPNANDSFAAWNQAYTMAFTLTARHPVSGRHIPWMATHWFVANDRQTVYYKLDPAARWSDGRPVTAGDYVFTFRMMRSKEIVDPVSNNYARTYFQDVRNLDDYTLMVVGKRPSWRPLDDYNLWPMPRQAIKLTPHWVTEANNTPQVAAGPYVVTRADPGTRIVFTKVKHWWGENKGYFKGLYNVDRINIRVIPAGRSLDYFKTDELALDVVDTARVWAEDTSFTAVRRGWVHKKRVFVDNPAGLYGLAMNLQAPIFQNQDFRKALQYLFDFNLVNRNIMYGAYYRLASAFTGTEYANPNLKPYPFDPDKAHAHLVKAGYTRRNADGILINATGEPARFTLIYGERNIEPHLTILQQVYNHFGIDLELKLLDGETVFDLTENRKYEMALIAYSAGYYPDPYQYFDSDFLKSINNNNIWAFGSPRTDKLIDTYRFSMDKQARLAAMWELDELIHDEAFYIPFWTAPYIRLLYWDDLCWPSFILPKQTESITDWQVFWIDPQRARRLAAARAAGRPLTPDHIVDVDAWGVKAAWEAKRAATREAGAVSAHRPSPPHR